jgi:DNA-binding MarR family transcriptional regulator
MAKVSVSRQDVAILSALDRGMSAETIRKDYGLSKQAITSAVRRLERLGLVRAYRTTAEGRAALKRWFPG